MTKREEFKIFASDKILEACKLIEKNKGYHLELVEYHVDGLSDGQLILMFQLKYPNGRINHMSIHERALTVPLEAITLPLLQNLMVKDYWVDLAHNANADKVILLSLAGWIYAIGKTYGYFRR